VYIFVIPFRYSLKNVTFDENNSNMCGRYSFASSKEKVAKQLGIKVEQPLEANYNIAPTQKAYIITDAQPDVLQQFRWGLIPYWARDTKAGSNLINARAEGIASKPSFRIPIRKQRCLVIADGFYEWRKEGRGMASSPFRIMMHDGALLVFAGIWDVWKNDDGEEIHSFSVITTRPNAEVSKIHNRMPVVLPNRDLQSRWFAEKDLLETLALLNPLEDDMLRIYAVSHAVNSVEANSPDLYNPVEPPPRLFD